MTTAMVEAIEAIRTRGGHRVWQWGGRWSTPDYMHVEVVASPAELATGIDGGVQIASTKEDWMTSDEAEKLLLGINHHLVVVLPGEFAKLGGRLDALEREWDAPAGGNKGEAARTEIDKLRRDMRRVGTKLGFEAES